MYITSLKLKNWRNFHMAEINFARTSYVIGPNASGKSNLLDALRFLRDVSKPAGGGLQKAVKDRGGITKLRCLHARRDPEVKIEVLFSERFDDPSPAWRYVLGFKAEGKGAQRLLISEEAVWRGAEQILNRPDSSDNEDDRLLTETYLEQTRSNADFRDISDFFSSITYLHLVPQLLKYGDLIGGNRLEDDPFGQGLLERVAKCQARTRDARLKKIKTALSSAVPHFRDLRFMQDQATGRPHLEALYEHHRPNAGWQREDQFSDGTLRLLGILWSLLDGNSLLLIEEPELSLHQAVIEQLPALMEHIQRSSKQRRQIIISSHSEALLSNKGIDAHGVIVLQPTQEGTIARPVSEEERKGLEAGFSVAEVVLPQTRPAKIEQMRLF
ncbi:MAG: AAA family ATPase [Syntrophorhabdus aromaticivorans]|uniref:AAA family ATPase n=1 Tax=Syntrophorhabdus aromaticivorans TaxID=328301 RepID=A0A971M774_9BACT|nr:AAA family ATPase [Syntrophorhabdus aromaticivorans]